MSDSQQLRASISKVIASAREAGDDLHDYANLALRVTSPAPATIATLILSEKARRLLHAVELLSNNSLDDQIATLARSSLEGAIDVQYLSADTTRRIKRRGVVLDVNYKANLFISHHEILGERLFPGRVDRLALEEAVQLRMARGLPGRSAYWHCSSTKLICEELKGRPDRAPPRLIEQHYDLFAHLSSFVHPHPHDRVYLASSQGGLQLTVGHDDLVPVTAAIVSCLDVFTHAAVRLKYDQAADSAITLMESVNRLLLEARRPPM